MIMAAWRYCREEITLKLISQCEQSISLITTSRVGGIRNGRQLEAFLFAVAGNKVTCIDESMFNT